MRRTRAGKAATERRAEWRAAVAEGRVVRYNGGLTFRSFPTKADAERFVALLNDGAGEVVAAIVQVQVPT